MQEGEDGKGRGETRKLRRQIYQVSPKQRPDFHVETPQFMRSFADDSCTRNQSIEVHEQDGGCLAEQASPPRWHEEGMTACTFAN